MADEMKRCPFCGEEILAIAKKCKHCGSMLEESGSIEGTSSIPVSMKPVADYEVFLLAIPAVSSMLIWFWVSGMNLLQSPGATLDLIVVATIIGSAIVAAMEAGKIGMTSDRSKGTYSPTAWFFIVALLWIVGYPAYLFKRRHFGLANRLVAGLVVALIFVASLSVMYSAIEAKKDEIRGDLEKIQQDLGSFENSETLVLPDSAESADLSAQPNPRRTTEISSPPNAAEGPAPISEQQPLSTPPQPLAQTTWAPSFNCAKASTFAENSVCNDSLLGKLDGALSANYKDMLASDIGDGAINDLKATQKKWLADRNKCASTQCLVEIYRKRIDEVCEYPVLSGAHPVCASSDDIK